MLLVSRGLPSNHGSGHFTPLPVHQIRLFELILEEPVMPRLALSISGLTTNHKTLNLLVLPRARLSNVFQKCSCILDIILNEELNLLETPVISELMNQRARVCRKLWQIQIYPM